MTLRPTSYEAALARQTRYDERRKAKLTQKSLESGVFHGNSLRSRSKHLKSRVSTDRQDGPGQARGQKNRNSGFSSKPRKRLRARRPASAKTVDGAGSRVIRDECDNLVRKILKLRDHSCITATCSATENLHVSHYVKRGVLALRWNLQNCNLSCDPCNEKHNTDQSPYRHAMVMWYGESALGN
jgi:5-methylcytosine-specific restriction endonuclease McrA